MESPRGVHTVLIQNTPHLEIVSWLKENIQPGNLVRNNCARISGDFVPSIPDDIFNLYRMHRYILHNARWAFYTELGLYSPRKPKMIYVVLREPEDVFRFKLMGF